MAKKTSAPSGSEAGKDISEESKVEEPVVEEPGEEEPGEKEPGEKEPGVEKERVLLCTYGTKNPKKLFEDDKWTTRNKKDKYMIRVVDKDSKTFEIIDRDGDKSVIQFEEKDTYGRQLFRASRTNKLKWIDPNTGYLENSGLIYTEDDRIVPQ